MERRRQRDFLSFAERGPDVCRGFDDALLSARLTTTAIQSSTQFDIPIAILGHRCRRTTFSLCPSCTPEFERAAYSRPELAGSAQALAISKAASKKGCQT